MIKTLRGRAPYHHDFFPHFSIPLPFPDHKTYSTKSSKEPSLPLQLSLEYLSCHGGIGLAFAHFHDLAFEEIQRGTFAGFEIGDRPRIRSDGFVAEFFVGA